MPNAAQSQGNAVTDPAGTPSPEIVALEARLNASFDKRVAGFQRAIGEKDQTIAQLQRQLQEQELAGLAPEDRAAKMLQRLQEENAQLRASQELDQLAGEYGDTLSLYKQLLGAGSAKDQLELLKGLSAAKPAGNPAEGDGGPEIPEIDMNNPVRQPSGGQMTDAMADRILGMVGRQADVTQNGPASWAGSGPIKD